MNLNSKTLSILKNFSTINPSIMIKEGNIIKTISPTKTILAKATIPDLFEHTFSLYNLSQFINSISMFNNPDLKFGDNSVKITDSDGNRSITYHYTDASLITVAPEKDLILPSIDAQFKLTNKDVQDVTKALGILGLPEIAIEGDGSNIILQAVDNKNQSSNQYRIIVGQTSNTFKAFFKPENLKIIAADYEVKLCSKGFSHFKSDDVEYFIAIESTSTF